MPSFPLRVSPRSAAAAVAVVAAAPVVVFVVAAAAVVVGVKRCKGFIKGEALLLQSRLFSTTFEFYLGSVICCSSCAQLLDYWIILILVLQ